MRIISPSVLSADFGNIERDIKMLDQSKAQWIHIDVMDGQFVPNISFGFPILKAIRKVTTMVLDVHLMILQPEKYVERFADAGADYITFHIEATDCPKQTIELIKKSGVKAGISIKPNTPVSAIKEFIPMLDMVLIMSVEPGFGGQSFIESSYEKVEELKALIQTLECDCLIEVDGGVSQRNARQLFDAGVDALVAGNAVFSARDPKKEIEFILNI